MEAEEEGEVAAARVSVVTAALLSHLRAFLSCLAFEVLSHGNLSSTSVAAFTETLEGMCRWPPSKEGGVGRAVTKLPQGAAIVLSQAPRNPLEPSLCCEVYYQLGPYNDRSVVLLDLLEAVLSLLSSSPGAPPSHVLAPTSMQKTHKTYTPTTIKLPLSSWLIAWSIALA
jgi:hypothetical protein